MRLSRNQAHVQPEVVNAPTDAKIEAVLHARNCEYLPFDETVPFVATIRVKGRAHRAILADLAGDVQAAVNGPELRDSELKMEIVGDVEIAYPSHSVGVERGF